MALSGRITLLNIPMVFGPAEAKGVIGNLSGHYRLIASLMYWAGLRLVADWLSAVLRLIERLTHQTKDVIYLKAESAILYD
jgi:hypothetical protein